MDNENITVTEEMFEKKNSASLIKKSDSFDLKNDEDIKEYINICEKNNRSNEKDMMQDLCDMIEGLQKELAETNSQLTEAVNEIQKLKDDKVTSKVKAFANDTKETALANIDKMQENLYFAKEKIKEFAKNTVENFKKVGIVVFDTVATILPIKSTLNFIKNDYRKMEKEFNDSAIKCDAIKTKLAIQLDNAKKALEVLKGNKVDFSDSEELVVKTSRLGDCCRNMAQHNGTIAKHLEDKVYALDNISNKAVSYMPEKWVDVKLAHLEFRDKLQSTIGIDTQRTGLKTTIENVKNQKAQKTR